MGDEQAALETRGVSVELPATVDLGPGAGRPEDRSTVHWLENRGVLPAVEISVDVVGRE